MQNPGAAQTTEPDQLPRVDVSTSKPKPRQQTRQSVPARQTQRPVRQQPRTTAQPASAPAVTGPGDAGGTKSPLNTNTVATSVSNLGLTVRETPATVEIVDQQMIRERGYRTVTETAEGAVGVTAGDFPGEPASFSMRGLTNSQITSLYNGIKIGPQNMTSRVMDTQNLDRVEFLKGPNSLMSGEGAAGGSVNFVNKTPHTGAIQNDAFASFDSLGTYRAGFGSGGSTGVQGLDYRFDLSRSSINGFVDDVNTKTLDISSQFNYRMSETFKAFVAFEYKTDHGNAYWGVPLVSAAFSGPNAISGIVSGSHTSFNLGTNLGPVTIDGRTLKTNYDVIDNINSAQELWLRGGFEWMLSNGAVLKTQAYAYNADRQWANAENYAFDPATGLVARDRFGLSHHQQLVGDDTTLTLNTNISGYENRTVFAVGASHLDFNRPGMAVFPPLDEVALANPARGTFGSLITRLQTATIDNVYTSIEDRLKITPTFALIGSMRIEDIFLDRNSLNIAGFPQAGFPFTKDWTPLTGRAGFTWEALPGLTWYGQVASAADVAANNIFLLSATQPLNLTRAINFETGLKQVAWNNQAEWSLSVFDMTRKNVYSAAGGMQLNIAGRLVSKGVELAGAIRPTAESKLWANFAFVDAHYEDFDFAGGSFSGNAPPNVPRIVVNAGGSYRFPTWIPVEIGASVRYVGDRFTSDANDVKMLAYTTADAYVAADLDQSLLPAWTNNKTRVTFRVRNLTDTKYAIWGDPFYPDQVLLGAPRTYEISASFKF